MKIILCTHKFIPPFTGGVDVYTDRLGRALHRLGHKIEVIAFDSSSEFDGTNILQSQDEYNGIKIHRLRFSFTERPKKAFDYAYDPEFGAIVKQMLQEQQPDLFIMMNFYMITLAPVEAAKDLNIPVVHITTDFLPICRRGTFIRWNGRSCEVGESIKSCSECFLADRTLGRIGTAVLNKVSEKTLLRLANQNSSYQLPHPLTLLNPYWKQVRLMIQRLEILAPLRQKIDLVLAPNQYIQNAFLTNGFTPKQVQFLPFGVEADSPLAKINRLPAPYVRFLFIGRLQPYKGAHLLIEAFNNLENPKNATLTVYGVPDDGYLAYFDQLKSMMAANERTEFKGKIAPTDLHLAFAEADYFVLPSTWHENSPLIVLDALQSKTPIIGSEIEGITDIVKDGINGLLFSMGNTQELKRVLQQAIDQPALLDKFRAGADLPDIENYAATMLRFCQEKQLLPQNESSTV